MNYNLEAGQVVATHGVRGEIKILPWADGPEFLLQFSSVRIGQNVYTVSSSRVHKTCTLMKLEGVDTVEQAAGLIRQVVMIDRQQAKLEEGSHFIVDLIGLRVLCNGEQIGVIRDVLSMPGNDVYVVKGEHEYMIPAVREFVDAPDLEAGTICVRLIEGMRTDEN